ncbi:pirin family protein [Glaciihabitans sp. dw_435]|uniref:pirin family protein n=1 Tax=Glaciihabitans sp. dw_435 TaxID=2720081 RepID=UPI001BD29394|nr:pirin family protein [Glaciihabitans sp. dw_435]
MSNLEVKPPETELVDPAESETTPPIVRPDATGFELLTPRDVPLGGPRAMEVRRTLPQRARSLIGAWCFVDHYGPDAVARTGGMVVPPHPHTGLQTVSWLFAGEVEHRDSSGAHAMVRPGELNLMTAGRGIQHSEVSTTDTTTLHGAQLWVALPDATRHSEPHFEHYAPPAMEVRATGAGDAATVRVFLGSLAGSVSPVITYSPLVGAQLDIPAETSITLDIDAGFEHGILLDAGELSADGNDIPIGDLAYFSTGRTTLTLTAGASAVRALLIGGAPLGERIVMWWNFIGRTHDEVVAYRSQWQSEVIGDATRTGRFGHVDGYDGPALPAPVLPNVRLRPRD